MEALDTARRLYRKIEQEPAYYKKKMRQMVCGDVIRLEFAVASRYQRELLDLEKQCSQNVRNLEQALRRSNGKAEQEERKEAEKLKEKLTVLAQECKTIARNIERTVKDFQALERSFARGTPKGDFRGTKRNIKQVLLPTRGYRTGKWGERTHIVKNPLQQPTGGSKRDIKQQMTYTTYGQRLALSVTAAQTLAKYKEKSSDLLRKRGILGKEESISRILTSSTDHDSQLEQLYTLYPEIDTAEIKRRYRSVLDLHDQLGFDTQHQRFANGVPVGSATMNGMAITWEYLLEILAALSIADGPAPAGDVIAGSAMAVLALYIMNGTVTVEQDGFGIREGTDVWDLVLPLILPPIAGVRKSYQELTAWFAEKKKSKKALERQKAKEELQKKMKDPSWEEGADEDFDFNIDEKPEVENQSLQNFVDSIYKGQGDADQVGNGTTMDAARYEIATGEKVHGSDHVMKSEHFSNGLKKLVLSGLLSPEDEAIARELIKDLLDATKNAN